MNRWSVIWAMALFATLLALGCSGSGTPTTPDSVNNPTTQSTAPQTHQNIWGYYDLYFDFENKSVEAVANRNVAFTANVVTFINPKPAGLIFKINDTPVFPEYIGVDIDVTIAHPLALAAYDGYDVKGIFVGNGSGTMAYDSQLKYAKAGTDQILTNADGYTRWFNPVEFTAPGVLGYTPGTYASGGYTGTATLNPYKYFAKGLSATGDVWTYLTTTSSEAGYFKNSTSNTRNYLLEFPIPVPGVKYGYAIAASWEAEDVHPAYAVESPAVNVTVTPDVYYVDNTDKGGNLILDVDIWGWDHMPTDLTIESTVFTANANFDLTAETPTGGDANYSTYHFEVPADNVTGNDGQEYWIILGYDGFDYSNPFSVPNGAGTDTLSAFFRFDLFVANEAYNKPPVINSGVTGEAAPLELSTKVYNVSATDPDSDPLTYTWTLKYKDTGLAVPGFDGVAGDGLGNLTIDYSAFPHAYALGGTEFTLDCVVTDNVKPPVDATQLAIKVDVYGDVWISNNAAFASQPKNGTKTQPYDNFYDITSNSANAGKVIVVDYGSGMYDADYLQFSSATWNNTKVRGYNWYTTGGGHPILRNTSGTYPFYMYNTTNVTIQGIKFVIAPPYSGSYMGYVYYPINLTVRDCWFTGTNNSTTQLYGIYSYMGSSSYSMTFENNKFGPFYTNYAGSTSGNWFYIYGLYSGIYGGKLVFRYNELSDMPSQTLNENYCYIYGIAAYGPGPNTEISNNLFHRILGWTGTSYYWWVYGMQIQSTSYGNPGVIANNTMDKIGGVYGNPGYGGPGAQGYYIYDSSQYIDFNSNIASNINCNANYTAYGWYKYMGGTYLTYNNYWLCDDGNYIITGGAGTGNINVDPKYKNNSTPPYDYHLDTGSGCIGTGKNGKDMGCYGNLPSNITKVGLVTAP